MPRYFLSRSTIDDINQMYRATEIHYLFINKIVGGKINLQNTSFLCIKLSVFKLKHSMGKFSRQQIDDIFLIFLPPENKI